MLSELPPGGHHEYGKGAVRVGGVLRHSGASVPLLDALAAAGLGGSASPVRPARSVRSAPPAVPPVVLDEFLGRPELDRLVEWVVGQRAGFTASRVISERGHDGRHDVAHRRSAVLFSPGPLQRVFEQRLLSVLDEVAGALRLPVRPVRRIEMQITASGDGEYFRPHTDNSHELLSSRWLTYVYFFHREPVRFTGGRLRVFDPRGGAQGAPLAEVTPRQNQIVFFSPHLLHEIETVHCPSGRFEDSRFTVNGWYRDDG
jgi:SM-20-related protein